MDLFTPLHGQRPLFSWSAPFPQRSVVLRIAVSLPLVSSYKIAELPNRIDKWHKLNRPVSASDTRQVVPQSEQIHRQLAAGRPCDSYYVAT